MTQLIINGITLPEASGGKYACYEGTLSEQLEMISGPFFNAPAVNFTALNVRRLPSVISAAESEQSDFYVRAAVRARPVFCAFHHVVD